jgi:hypothetical protein
MNAYLRSLLVIFHTFCAAHSVECDAANFYLWTFFMNPMFRIVADGATVW